MASSRPATTDGLVENPFIKKRNLEWTINLRRLNDSEDTEPHDNRESLELVSTPAAVEAGHAHVEDHLAYFSQILEKHTQSPYLSGSPHLPVAKYRGLYSSNSGNPSGSHFIIHQHDHPIAGTHYDLRLQINETSSASWAIMYGLPGDLNSMRLNRNATETRVHCLWNHLIESASAHTGSLLIWDTGTYSILPRRSKHDPTIDPDSERSSSPSSQSPDSSSSDSNSSSSDDDERHRGPWQDKNGPRRRRRRRRRRTRRGAPTEQEKLHQAFANRNIRLQLHGTRLPESYVLNLRLTRSEDVAGRQRSKRSAAGGPPRKKRRRGHLAKAAGDKEGLVMTSSDDKDQHREIGDGARGRDGEDDAEEVAALEKELRELEDGEVRRTNAYAGAQNTIGSVHQRRWYLSLDRAACGFARRYRRRHEGAAKDGRKVGWVEKNGTDGVAALGGRHGGDEGDDDDDATGKGGGRLKFPFYVRGVEAERSVVTGRLGADVLRDEGVVDYLSRQGWRPVLE